MPSSLAILGRAMADPDMRRLQLASASWSAGEAAYLVGLFVFAYVASGPGGVAIVAVIRTVPSVILAPTMAALASDRSVDRSIRWTLGVRLVTVAALAGALIVGWPIVVVYALAGMDSVAATFLRPLRNAILPGIARSPEELVAGNVALTTGDSLANLVGPALAAAALVVMGTVGAFAPGLLLLTIALAASAGLHTARPLRASRPATAGPVVRPGRLDPVRWLVRSPAVFVVGMFTVQRLVRGGLTVLLVAAAVDLLGMGEPGVGILTAAIGLGGLLGGGLAVGLVGRSRLAPWFALGIGMWGLGVAVAGVIPVAGVALAALAAGGVGKVLIDVAGYSLLQRSIPNDLRTSVLGIQEGLVTAALAVGSVAATILIDVVGIGPAMAVAGAAPVAVAVLAWPALRRVDGASVVPERDLALLRGVPMFEPLQLATIEELASGMERRVVAAGEVIVRQGEPGDRFYLIDTGEVAVEIDGQAGSPLRAGDSFGEIALIRDVPRTATVTALTQVDLAAIERTRFLEAVTGHRHSAAAADRIVSERLGS